MTNRRSKITDEGTALGRVILPVASALAVTGALVFFTPLDNRDGAATASTVLTAQASATAPATAAASETDVTEDAAAAGAGNVQQIADASAGGAFNAEQQAEIETLVRSYLLKNPEILLEMQSEYEKRAETQREEQMRTALASQADTLYRSTTAPERGNDKGDVTVVEFFDYNCGFCKRALEGVNQLLDADKNVRVVFKEFPIFGEDSEAAARAALAAAKQDKYWEMHRDLFAKPGRANEEKALQIADALGLDVAKLKTDMQSPEITAEISRVQDLAEAMGIRGTPHFFIDDKVIPGAPENLFEQLQERIASVRSSGGCKVC